MLLFEKGQNGQINVYTHFNREYGFGCGHFYSHFLPNHPYGPGGEAGYYAAYIYDPTIPEAQGITTEITDSIVFSDDYYVICD